MMCGANKKFFLYLLFVLLLLSAAGVLRAGEQDPWYLISEGELSSIEEYRMKSETEKHKGAARNRLIVIIALAGSRTVFIAFKICRFFMFFNHNNRR
jgi:hypothetical protein